MSIEIQNLSKTFFPGTSREHKALKTSAYPFKKETSLRLSAEMVQENQLS